MWCSSADTHLKLLVCQWCPFSNWGVFECDIAHRRSEPVLCMNLKDQVNPLRSLNGALPVAYVLVRITRGPMVAHRSTYAPPRCRNSQDHLPFIPLSASMWNDLADPVFDDVGLDGFKSRVNVFSSA